MVLGSRKKEIGFLKQRLTQLEAENYRLKETLTKSGFEESQYHTLPLLRQIVEMHGLGFWGKSIDNTVFWMSSIAREITGLGGSSAITWEQFKHTILPDDRLILDKCIAELKPGDKPVELEVKIARSDGDGREYRVIGMMISFSQPEKDSGETALLVASLKDISRQEKLKKDLIRAKDKAEEAEKLKNTLLANISHEIRTPMNAIIGFSELLHIGNLPRERRHEYVKTIKNQGLLLLKMMDDVVELTRMETGKITIRKSPCNIDLLLNELMLVFDRFKATLNKGHLEIRVSYPQNRGITMYTDPGRLQQVFSQLITNSIKYTEKGWIEIGYKVASDQRIEFYVKDTGIGLSKDLQKNIFNVFTEEDIQDSKHEGSGLGLTISRNIVKLLGGKIRVESEQGEGSTFYFSLPLDAVPESFHSEFPEEEFQIPAYSWKDKVILVVEDDDVNFKFLEAVLQDTFVQILHAKSGAQAVELCRTISKIDLVLMDILMPEMDGIQATKLIRDFNPKIPIIAQTAYAIENEKEKCIEAGCNDHIAKPIEINEFFEKLDRFLKEK